MPGGFALSSRSGNRQTPTYVWDLLPYSRRSAVHGLIGDNGGAATSDQMQASGSMRRQASAPEAAGNATDHICTISTSYNKAKEQQQQPTGGNDLSSLRLMSMSEARRVQQLYARKVASCHRYELVAAFSLQFGEVQAYFPFRTRVAFQLTERRRRLLRQYYGGGRQMVALYVNEADFEHYMPLQMPRKARAESLSSGSVWNWNWFKR